MSLAGSKPSVMQRQGGIVARGLGQIGGDRHHQFGLVAQEFDAAEQGASMIGMALRNGTPWTVLVRSSRNNPEIMTLPPLCSSMVVSVRFVMILDSVLLATATVVERESDLISVELAPVDPALVDDHRA